MTIQTVNLKARYSKDAGPHLFRPLVCPATYYPASFNTPFPKGVWFFQAGGPDENGVVYYSEDAFGSDLRRKVVPYGTTIIVDKNLPVQAIEQARRLNLVVKTA